MHLFKIGDFSNLSQVSVKTLRYYERIGLLKPMQVDSCTGYRYYSAEQLPRLNRILALKDLGFSLEQISTLLNNTLSLAQMRGMLMLKQAETQQLVEAEQAKMVRIEARLRQIEQEDTMPEYEVIRESVHTQRVASIRGLIPTRSQMESYITSIFTEMATYMQQYRASQSAPALMLWYDQEFREHDLDVEIALPTNDLLPDSERIRVYELPVVANMACVVHHGSFATIGPAYNAISQWIQINGHHMGSPHRLVYIYYDQGIDPSSYVTELQFPVKKHEPEEPSK